MVVVSYSGKEINSKLVYYGAGLSGKTTNLESIYEAVPDTSRGKMVSMKTQSDRTLFFDLLPLNLGEIMGFKTRFLLYTVPGQVFYNATRKLVLKGADAIVFVADSEIGKMDENKESLQNLRANLAEYGVRLEDIPWVLQYNKRDLDNRYSIDELQKELNPDGTVPYFEAVAMQGKGVFETFRGISHMLLEKVAKDLKRTPFGGSARKDAGAGRADAPASTVMSNPFAKGSPPTFGREVSLTPEPRAEAAAANPAGEMPEIVVDASNDGPEATLEAAPSSDFVAEPVAPPEPMRPTDLRATEAARKAMPQAKQPQRPAPPRAPEPPRKAEDPPRKPGDSGQLRIEPELTGRPAEVEARVSARPAARISSDAHGPREAVIPVVLPRGGGGREIVIRIIVSEEEEAA